MTLTEPVDDNTERSRLQRLAETVGCTLKPGVLDILRNRGSFDVQAVPGSGKTTTVAAKVLIALDQWRGAGGICILTHTNVAKNEISKRLRASEIGVKALQYPHFIGTIHSFVARFLAQPYLRGKGIHFSSCSDELFEISVHGRAKSKTKLLGFLKNKGLALAYQTLEYAPTSAELIMNGEPCTWNPATDSYKELSALKSEMTARGIFRYADMFHYANRCLDEWTWAIEALRKRFSLLIIDEMQDTTIIQDQVLERVFSTRVCTVQRFGDRNQQIFNINRDTEEGTSFPRAPVLELGKSSRYGQFVADALTIVAPDRQTILGNDSEDHTGHTVFLFDAQSIPLVIPAFATTVHSVLGDAPSLIIKAIGHRASSGDSVTYGDVIGDYGYKLTGARRSIRGDDSFYFRCKRARLVSNLACSTQCPR